MNSIEEIAKQAIEKTIYQLCEKVIVEHGGWGIETELKQVIKEKAKILMETDKELKKLLRDQLVYWIENQ